MNYTENYQLPQWVESDRVLMDDFNDAMRKTDLELHRCMHCEKIEEITVDTQTPSFEIDVSGVSWEKYLWIILDCDFYGLGTGEMYPIPFEYQTNSPRICAQYGIGIDGGHMTGMILLPCLYRGSGIVGSWYSSGTYSGMAMYERTTFGEITALHFEASTDSYYFGSGSRVTLWAIK